eukprot:gene6867-biopygen12669
MCVCAPAGRERRVSHPPSLPASARWKACGSSTTPREGGGSQLARAGAPNSRGRGLPTREGRGFQLRKDQGARGESANSWHSSHFCPGTREGRGRGSGRMPRDLLHSRFCAAVDPSTPARKSAGPLQPPARALYQAGVGKFGGFYSSPREVGRRLTDHGVRLCLASDVAPP